MYKDLNSKVDVQEFNETITELETEISKKAANSVVTTSANGLMSSSDKTKLNGIATNANNYSHPTSSGNKHIPSGGSSGQYLKWSADGTATWASIPAGTTYTAGTGLTLSGTTFSANIGTGSSQVAAGNHTHSYLPLSGGTLTGEVIYNNYLSLNAWSGYGTGKVQLWYNGDKKEIAANNSSLADIKVNGGYVYHQGRKPTPADIGAAAASHTHNYAASSHTHNYAGSSSAGGAATSALACTGNSATATKLATARTINGTSFDGSGAITTANWGTTRTITIGNTGKSVNGSGNVSWSLSEIGAAATSHTHNYAGSSSAGGAATSALACTGNSATATKLATARTINGTSFDGSGAITTANWGTARTITIGSTGKSVNGSGNVSWSLSEIGAAAASHTHSYLPLSGGTLTGKLTGTAVTVSGDVTCSGVAAPNTSSKLWLTGYPVTVQGHMLPYANASYDFGNSYNRWRSVYASNGTIQTSDERFKDDIVDVDDEQFFEMVKGVSVNTYVMRETPKDENQRSNEIELYTQETAPSDRIHVGIIAQEMAKYDCGKYILVKDSDTDYYSINNYNFTSAIMAALKVEISKREELEKQVNELKNLIAK